MKNFILGMLSAVLIAGICGAVVQDRNRGAEYEHIYIDPENFTMQLFTDFEATPVPKNQGVFFDTLGKLQKSGWRVVSMDDVGFVMMREK
ncbi:MAG: hypothetical protein CMJ76_09915 [Planctomycetaceae bacterium]|nr:hypothetical protein [Planctomycetaceae bacterium]|tara:strand:- start:1987 stop:2256 length:270 start_codon:yes stop_codon:yes gene_type:complete